MSVRYLESLYAQGLSFLQVYLFRKKEAAHAYRKYAEIRALNLFVNKRYKQVAW